MKRHWKKWLIGAGAAAGLTALMTRWPNLHDVSTGETPEYPDLPPRRYGADPDRVFLAAQETGHEMPGWRLRDIEPGTRSFYAEVAVALTPMMGDVWVSVTPDGDGAIVRMRSKSRTGSRDFGANARRIRAYFKALDARLGASGTPLELPMNGLAKMKELSEGTEDEAPSE
jgi:uncharacterized protein (DUF1499 family)